MSDHDSVALVTSVDQKIEKVRTRSLDVSFNELLDMYENKELKIDPEFQRLFRWSEGSQSRFIESLILEMPIPPIFVIEESEGIYELIDGLQRISSYLHFRGKHPLRQKGDGSMEYLRLADCDIVPELNGLTYNDLPKPLEIKLKRNFIRVEVLRKESDRRLRYYMFKRLNTGGELLSPQEMRNCTIRLLNDDFNKFLIQMSKDPHFMVCISNLTDEKIVQKVDQELVLRFFAFKNDRDSYEHNVGDFLTEYMEAVSDPETAVQFDYSKEEGIFKKTFLLLQKSLGKGIFSSTNASGTLVGSFSVYHFEAFTLGIQPLLDILDPEDESVLQKLSKVFQAIKMDADFRRSTTGGGKNYRHPLNRRIDFVLEKVREAL